MKADLPGLKTLRPATTHTDQTKVVWWFVDYRWNGSAWSEGGSKFTK